ncbi:MAG: NAD(P)/FAD-dependent oxidoreductase, partial [Clostridia bacterium]|nr:NAD(P)/FAD-dependent oxidoreductase [Clostridia bacterium]
MDNVPTAIIGGGPAGLMAAYFAAVDGENSVTLYERNEKPGKKLYITGKGRCNVTNACAPDEFLENVPRNPKFLQSAVRGFPPERLMAFLEECG